LGRSGVGRWLLLLLQRLLSWRGLCHAFFLSRGPRHARGFCVHVTHPRRTYLLLLLLLLWLLRLLGLVLRLPL